MLGLGLAIVSVAVRRLATALLPKLWADTNTWNDTSTWSDTE